MFFIFFNFIVLYLHITKQQKIMTRRKNMGMIDRAIARSQEERKAMTTSEKKYRGYYIQQRTDVPTQCASIFFMGELVKMIAAENASAAIAKAEKYIDAKFEEQVKIASEILNKTKSE